MISTSVRVGPPAASGQTVSVNLYEAPDRVDALANIAVTATVQLVEAEDAASAVSSVAITAAAQISEAPDFIERLKSVIDIDDDLPGEDENAFNTLGGLMMFVLGRIPEIADHFEVAGCRFEVVDMDKNRVDKVLLTRLAPPLPLDDEGEAAL